MKIEELNIFKITENTTETFIVDYPDGKAGYIINKEKIFHFLIDYFVTKRSYYVNNKFYE